MWTLLHYPLCPASRAIRLALNEAGIEAERQEVKPWAITREFLNLNPAGTLPVLVIEGKAICGVYPVVEYLAETVVREGPAAVRSGYWPEARPSGPRRGAWPSGSCVNSTQR